MLPHRLIYKDAHGREPCIVMGVSVCFYVSVYVFVCLSVRENVSGSARPILWSNFLGMLPVVVARSSSGGVAIRYVL